eukprot:4011034-Pyramimonas_sp.AAC.1
MQCTSSSPVLFGNVRSVPVGLGRAAFRQDRGMASLGWFRLCLSGFPRLLRSVTTNVCCFNVVSAVVVLPRPLGLAPRPCYCIATFCRVAPDPSSRLAIAFSVTPPMG